MQIGTVYLGKQENKEIFFSRVWSMPSPWTFSIRPVKLLLDRYVINSGQGWIDPFAGEYSPAEIRNDHNPKKNAEYHMEAIDFVQKLEGKYNGILFDPPYSYRQISEHYKLLGMKATKLQTSIRFYESVKSAAVKKIKKGGFAISCGWNTNGFGKARGFEIVEILFVAHGGSKNDTIVTVEKKIKAN